jgi:dCMP deaminase
MHREPEEWLLAAYKAATKSPDLSTQNGAIIVAQNDVVLQACNDFPRRVTVKGERLERPLKYSYTEHAERNVIYEAARLGVSTQGCVMYATWVACTDCARGIIQAGITKVVTHKATMDMTPEHWRESINTAFEMLKEAGVDIVAIDATLNAPKVRFNGKWWTP